MSEFVIAGMWGVITYFIGMSAGYWIGRNAERKGRDND